MYLKNKIITEIESCWDKFYHGHDLIRLSLSKIETTKKLLSRGHKGSGLCVAPTAF